MRKLASLLVTLFVVTCARDPAASVGVTADVGHGGAVVISQPTGSWDIYVYDVNSGTTTQASTIAGADEWNAAFSNNGRAVVHEVIGSHDLYITQIATHVSTRLVGGEGGNDADWSPNGQRIAFDGDWGDPNLYVIPASGGTRTLVRAIAMDPSWGPDNQHLVFRDNTDWSVRTIDLRSGSEHVVAPFGVNPAWSRDGRRIAYSDNNSIFVVAVDPSGAAVGAPVQLTFDGSDVYNGQLSWSNDSKSIVFHSNRGNTVYDFDVWSVPASGGTPTHLFGTAGEGDYDPTYGITLVAFSKFTPPGP